MSIRANNQGFSLIELLTVLAIVGILAIAGAFYIGDRRAGAVRAVMDELEGTIASAQQLSTATGRDVLLAANGNWAEGGTEFLLAYGNAITATGAVATRATILVDGKTASESFHFQPRSRDHMSAGVVTVGSDWWGRAASGNVDIRTVPPFDGAISGFNTLLADPSADAGNLANPAGQDVRISGANKRFIQPFYVAVVALRNGQPMPGGPMGLLVVLGNGATVYKFYTPGAGEGWRKL